MELDNIASQIRLSLNHKQRQNGKPTASVGILRSLATAVKLESDRCRGIKRPRTNDEDPDKEMVDEQSLKNELRSKDFTERT